MSCTPLYQFDFPSAFSNPPTASPVDCARFSVDIEISFAIGIIASAAEKKMSGAEAWLLSRMIEMGKKIKSQKREGRRIFLINDEGAIA